MLDIVGFHILKDKIRLRYTEAQASRILSSFDAMVQETKLHAPRRLVSDRGLLRPRDESFIASLTQSPDSREDSEEKHWERACFEAWSNSSTGIGKGVPFKRIVYYQMPLRNKQKDKGWGAIDLLGADEKARPVIIELKSKHTERLLRAMCEVLGYGIAIRKSCNSCEPTEGAFRAFWESRIRPKTDLSDSVCIPLVIAAPSQYWAAVLSTSSGPVEGKTPFEARPILRDILERASKDGFPITLVSLKGEGAGKSLRVVGAEAISLQSRLVPTGK